MSAPSKSNSGETPDDAQLVSACRRGEKRAFVEIVARHQAMVCGIAFAILNDFPASEDAAQEAFLTAWRKIHELRDPARLRPWLARIARNAALAQLRRQHPAETLDNAPEFSDPGAKPDESTASEEETQLVRAALDRLPELYRLPLVLFYREDQSVRAVAESLGISEDAVKQRLARGRDMLRERVESALGRVLARSGPSAVFTMTIAVAIGALAAPATIAATAFAAGTTTASAATTSSSLFTATGTTKVLAAAAVLAIASIPVGYHFANHFYPGAPDASLAAPFGQRRAAQPTHPSFESSVLFAEWRALHDKYGTNAQAMPLLYQAIQALSDTYRRRAFLAAQYAEWARIDAASGLAFFQHKKRNGDEARQFFGEWFASDPTAALNAVLASDPVESEIARGSLTEIARRFPEKLSELVSRMPEPESFWRTEVRDAFAFIADGDLSGARSAAESVTGPNREQALSGVARISSRSNLDDTITWARTLGPDADEVIRAALIGEASLDPSAALDRVGLVPSAPKRPGYSHITTGRRVLEEAAAADFRATTQWLVNHPGQLSEHDLDGMSHSVTERLDSDPISNLQTWAAEGSLSALTPAIGSALLNAGAGMRDSVWDWLKNQPDDPSIRALREDVLRSAGHYDVNYALNLAKDLPRSPSGDQELERLARSLLNGGNFLNRFDELFTNATDPLRAVLLDGAFHYLSPETMDDPQKWLTRLPLLPASQRLSGIESVAQAWAWRSPEQAVNWVSSLEDPQSRAAAAAGVVSGLARTDTQFATEWLQDMPPGLARDRATTALVMRVAEDQPHQAWEWAASISDPTERDRAAAQVIHVIAERDPGEAAQWVESGPFTPSKRAALRLAMGTAAPK